MNRFKEAREKRGLSRKETAISLEVSLPTVSDWENGNKMPTPEKIVKLADLYGVTTDYLLDRPMNIYDTLFYKALSRFCFICEKDISPILDFYRNNPVCVDARIKNLPYKLIERTAVEKVLGDLSVEMAVFLGCSPKESMEEYSDFYMAYISASKEKRELIDKVIALDSTVSIGKVLGYLERDSENMPTEKESAG